MDTPPFIDTVVRECIAGRLRVLGRVVTGLYDDALRPHGLRITQASILVAVAKMKAARPGDVCRVLQLEKSTLSRDVKRLLKRGWLEAVPDPDDGRAHRLRITAKGLALLEKTYPVWREAQKEAKQLLGATAVDAVVKAADGLWCREHCGG